MDTLRPAAILLVMGLTLAPATAVAQPHCPKGGGSSSVQTENDVRQLSWFGTDDAYTAGARFDFGNRGIGDDGRPPVGTTWPFRKLDPQTCFTWGVGLGLNLYTPTQIETPELQAYDRPYGAWLFGAYRLTRFRIVDGDVRRTESIELSVGVLGQGAAGKWFQNKTHEVFRIQSKINPPGIKYALGWHHQLRNEAAVNLRYETRHRLKGAPATVADRRYDLLVHGGGSAGTVFTWATTGATFRFGKNIPNDLGPHDRQESVLKARADAPKAFVYGFVSADARLVFRNAFLDGNWFARDRADRGRVQKSPAVGDLVFGGSMQLCRWFRVTYQNVRRTTEFQEQVGQVAKPVPHRYGSIAVAVVH